MKETDLYLPLKAFLEKQEYEVKAEVGDCDVFAVRGSEAPLVVELKLSLNLTVILQAVERLKLTDLVYIGVPSNCTALKTKLKPITRLCRMLGIGLLSINPSRTRGAVLVHLDPGSYTPRKSKRLQSRVLGEFHKRKGDPNLGGATASSGKITAYRQQALRIAYYLQAEGACKVADVARYTEDKKTGAILYKNVYGWFERTGHGVYALSPHGSDDLTNWPNV